MTDSQDIGDFLAERVWPELDAASAGLLDDLSPKLIRSYYQLTCPSCGKRRAYYYPRSSIRCNRIEECSYRSSVWNYMLDQAISKADIIERVCDAVGVTPPDQKPRSQKHSLDFKFKRILQGDFHLAAKRIQDRWKYSDQEMAFIAERCGYYSTVAQISKQLTASEIKLARSLGLLSENMEDRLVGFWRQPSGGLRLWGRALGDQSPKYKFGWGTSKTAPYLIYDCAKGLPLLAVEGARDALALLLMGFRNSCATGGNHLNFAQARFLCDRVDEVVYVIDGDLAGMRGIVSTTQNCRAFGITPKFAIIPVGEDLDPDKYRELGRVDEMKSIIENAYDCGTALALTYIALRKNPEDASLLKQIPMLRSDLSTYERKCFDKTLAAYGMETSPERDAARDMSVLLLHFSLAEANEIIARRYGFNLEFVKAPIDG